MQRNFAIGLWLVVTLAGAVVRPGIGHAGIEDWQVSEVVISAAGDPGIRYIELHNPVGGCLFPTSRIEVYGSTGELVGAVAPVAATTCVAAGAYYLLATSAAVAYFGTGADAQVVPPIPAVAAQVCITSSGTRYDCVRWGVIAGPVMDLFGSDDSSVAPTPADGVALARVAVTDVVADDWDLQAPTPRGPNDGAPWIPPDAGPMPDARPVADAGPLPDALVELPEAMPADARVRVDARNQRFLDLDPVGGATCGCRVGGARERLPWAPVALLASGLLWLGLAAGRGGPGSGRRIRAGGLTPRRKTE